MTRRLARDPLGWPPTILLVRVRRSHADADRALFDEVQVIGVDEYVWRRTCRGDKLVTVISDPTPVGARTSSANRKTFQHVPQKKGLESWLSETATTYVACQWN